MLFGLQMFPTDYSMSPVDFGAAAEARGFESVFFPEHTHIPVSRDTPWPTGGELPREFAHALEPFVAMTAVAATTSRVRVGTAVCLVAQRDPILLAKQIASLDLVSGGRFLFGVGAGWNAEEIRNHGTDPATRWRLMQERIEAMTAVWTQDEASYHGRMVDFDPLWSWPKPVQRPRPPVLVGGGGPRVLDRVLAYGDEWMPFRDGSDDWDSAAFRSAEPEDFDAELARRIDELQTLAEERGRGRVPVTLFNAKPHPAAIERYAAMGVHRCIFWLPSEKADVLMPRIDQISEGCASR
ncbi:LLM class F420-dependent oxidoreductase [Streptomyces sp. NPDC046909]|uniref:LLM class F420-dependent oxidoreductase n=1 Tax=Streptomyces sp. NPDC046909 TaxID=3155617 RepID=UPI00340746A3